MRNGYGSTSRMAVGVSALLLAATLAACGSSGSKRSSGTTGSTAATGSSGGARGFDGTTIKVAGIGVASQFAGTPTGAMARIKRFNDTNEIPGVKIQYVEFADDKL